MVAFRQVQMQVLSRLLNILKGKARILLGKLKVLLIRLIWRDLLLIVIPSRIRSMVTSNWSHIGLALALALPWLQKALKAKCPQPRRN